jgi:hypothetical protein
MAKGKGYVPFGKKGKPAADKDADDKFIPGGKGKPKGNPFAAMGKKGK